MNYQVLNTIDLFTQQKEAWEALLCDSNWSTIFQQPSIQEAWWLSHEQPELAVFTVYNEQKLVGVVPLFKKKDGRTFEFLGDADVSDYLDIVTTAENFSRTLKAFTEFLQSNTEWSALKLVSIPAESPTLPALQQLAHQNGWLFKQTQQDVCPIIELPTTWEEYLSAVGKKQRHEMTRKWRRLEEAGKVEFRIVTDIEKEPTALETFLTLHSQSSTEKATFWTPAHRQYFELVTRVATQKGWLRLYFLDFDGEPAATLWCFDYQDGLLLYNSGFNAEKFSGMSIGNVLTSYSIQDAIKLGKKKYDFLRGAEEYKFRYAATPHPVYDLLVQRESGS